MIASYLKDHQFYFDVLNDDNIPYQQKLDLPISWKKSKAKHFDVALRYIMFLYDSKSPFTKKFPNFEERKKQAMIEASSWGEVNEGWMQDVIENKDEKVLDIIVDFLKIQNDKVWSSIVSDEELFLEYTRTLMKPIESITSDKDLIQATTIKGKIREERAKVLVELEGLYEKFYNKDKDLEEVVKGKKMSPEFMARKVK